MKAITLLRKFTPVKTAVHFLSISVFIISFNSSSQAAEIGGTTTVAPALSDHQFDTGRCNDLNDKLNTARTDLAKACSKAGLSSSENACTESLEKCEGDKGKDNLKCLNHSISTDQFKDKEEREDKIRDRIQDLQADYDDEVQRALEIAKEKSAADGVLENTLSELGEKGETALINEVDAMDNIADGIAKKHDELDTQQLNLRKFILDNQMECRKNAEKIKTAYIAEFKKRAANGQRIQMSQGQLFNRSKVSVNETGTIKYNRYLKNCTSLFTKNGKLTGFGAQYRLQKATIDKQNSIIKRDIRTLSKQRGKVRQAKTRTVQKLSRLKSSALATHLRSVDQLRKRGMAAQAKESQILASINEQEVRLGKASNKSTDKMTQIMEALTKSRKKTAVKREPELKSKIEAFTDADSYRAQVLIAKEAAESCSGNSDGAKFSTDAAADLTTNSTATAIAGATTTGTRNNAGQTRVRASTATN